jgi:hypothetical protein
MNRPTEPITGGKPRRIRVAALLNVATLVAAVVVGAIPAPKIPPMQGD